MGVAIRQYELANERVRLSLDIYHGGKSRFENLGLFLHKKPKTQNDREHNRKTMALAESIKAKRILEIQEHRYNVQNGFNGQQSFLAFFRKMADERSHNVNNYDNWNCTYKHLKKFVRGRDLSFDEVNESMLNGFKNYLLTGKANRGRQNLSKNSVITYISKIKAALNQASIDNIITYNPAKRLKGIKPVEVRKQYLLAEELKLLTYTACKMPVIKKAFLFSCLTGLRWSDVDKLTWKDITFSEAECIYKINFTQKKTNGIEYHPVSLNAIKLLGKRGDDDQRIFQGLKYTTYHNSILADWVADAGITKKITFHCARHTYATLLLTAGGDIYTVSSLLGHKDLKTTQIYAKIINTKKNSIVDLLPDIGF